MLKKIFNISICLIIYLNYSFLYSQENYKEYHKNLYRAKKAQIKDSLDYYYNEASKDAVPFPEDILNFSKIYLNFGDKEKAKELFYEAIKKGYQVEEDSIRNKCNFQISYSLGFIDFREKRNKYEIFISSFSDKEKDLIKKYRQSFLEQLSINDNETYEIMLTNEHYFQSFREIVYGKVNDSIFEVIGKYAPTVNSYYMLNTLRNGCFPSRRKCIRFNSQTISMLLNHAIAGLINQEDALEFLNYLWNEVEKGNITPNEYASAYDQYIHWFIDEEKSLFGTKNYYNIEKQQYMLMNLLVPSKVNQIRKKHWLNSIEEYCQDYEILLPKNYE